MLITGTAVEREPTEAHLAKGYVIFELLVGEVVATSYERSDLGPIRTQWTAARA